MCTAQPPMTTYELLERRNLAGCRVVRTIDEYIRRVAEAVGASQVRCSVGAKGCQRILPFYPVVAQVVRAARTDDEGAVLG